MNPLVILIDGGNLFHSAKQHGEDVDYSKLLRELSQIGGGQFLRAMFYTGANAEEDSKQRGFLLWMRRNGYQVVTKPIKVADATGRRHVSLEVEITTDMLHYASLGADILLVSGDDDFAYPVRKICNSSSKVTVAGFEDSTSSNLRNVADNFINLADLPVFKESSERL